MTRGLPFPKRLSIDGAQAPVEPERRGDVAGPAFPIPASVDSIPAPVDPTPPPLRAPGPRHVVIVDDEADGDLDTIVPE